MFKPTRSPLEYLLLTLGVGVAGLVLLFLGAFTAVAPELMARITPIFLLVLVMLSAGFVRSSTVSQRLVTFWLSVIVVTAALWPSYMAVRIGGLPSIDLRKIVFGLSVLLFLYLAISRSLISQRWRELAFGAKAVVWLVLIYGLLRVVSALESIAPVPAFLAVAWEWVYYYIPFFIVLFLMANDESRKHFVRLTLVLTFVIAAFAVFERIAGLNPLVRFAQTWSDAAESMAALNISRLRDGTFRAQATFEHPLMLAEFATVITAFAFGQFLVGRSKLARVFGFLLTAAGGGAAVLSGSRVALVSLAIVLGSVALATGVRARRTRSISTAVANRLFVLLSILALAAIAVPILQALLEGRTATEASSSSARVQMLRAGLPAMLEHPLLGHGYGEAVIKAGVHGTGGLLTLDNYLLTVGIESGVPALLVFVAIFLVPAWMAFKKITDEASGDQAFLISALAALLGLLTVRVILSIPYNLIFTFVIAAFVVGAIPRKQSSNGQASVR